MLEISGATSTGVTPSATGCTTPGSSGPFGKTISSGVPPDTPQGLLGLA